MDKVTMPGAAIGIIGGGQLGKMLAQSAQKMGYRIGIYDPNSSSCSFNVSHFKEVASFDDSKQVHEFVNQADLITYEFENINGRILKDLEATGKLPQGSKLLLKSQDRLMEKTWLQEIGTQVVDFRAIRSWQDILAGLQDLSYPFILKTNRFGYDGKGQYKVQNEQELLLLKEEIEEALKDQDFIMEAFCPFEYEISVIIGRDQDGHVQIFPISQNIHQAGILFSSLVGKDYSSTIQDQVQDYCQKLAQEGHLIGVCGVEFFVTQDERVIINEIAPRPHNTGHYSIESCNVSQFDQHILAVTGRPLVDVKLLSPALMINILGQHLQLLDQVIQRFPNAILHIYDKGQAKKHRKMGHFTIMDSDVNVLQSLLESDPLLNTIKSMY